MAERHLYQNSDCIYCAESIDQCWDLWEQDTGDTRADAEADDPFEQLADDAPLELGGEDAEGTPGEVAREIKNRRTGEVVGVMYFETKLVREWAAECVTVGHFSGGDY